LRLKILKKQR